jgi:hypothetical protein
LWTVEEAGRSHFAIHLLTHAESRPEIGHDNYLFLDKQIALGLQKGKEV